MNDCCEVAGIGRFRHVHIARYWRKCNRECVRLDGYPVLSDVVEVASAIIRDVKHNTFDTRPLYVTILCELIEEPWGIPWDEYEVLAEMGMLYPLE